MVQHSSCHFFLYFDISLLPGNVYIADTGNNRIRKVTMTGNITTIAGGIGTSDYSGDGGAATLATLSLPKGVSLDSSGEQLPSKLFCSSSLTLSLSLLRQRVHRRYR